MYTQMLSSCLLSKYLIFIFIFWFKWCSGIGIVNAIEVLNSFPEEDGLHKFREWVESPDPNILGKVNVETGSSSRKRGSKVGSGDQSHSKNNMDAFDENVSQNEHNESVDDIQSGKQIFMDKHVITILPALGFTLLILLYYWRNHLWLMYCFWILWILLFYLEKCEQELAHSFFFSKWNSYFCICLSPSGPVNRAFLVGKTRSFCSSQVSWLKISTIFERDWCVGLNLDDLFSFQYVKLHSFNNQSL